MTQSYARTFSIRVPRARSLAALAIAAAVVAAVAVGGMSLAESDTPTALAQETSSAQEAPVAQEVPIAEEAPVAGATPIVETPAVAIPAAVPDPVLTVQDVPAGAQDAPAFAVSDVVVVNADGLNFRGEPGLDSGVAAVLPAGQAATVVAGPTVADDFTWYQLDANGVTGWSAGEFLAPAGTTLAFAAQTPAAALFPVGMSVVVADGDLNLRADAGLAGAIQDQLATGTAATILAGPTAADGYTWYQLDVDGLSGWSAGEFLAPA